MSEETSRNIAGNIIEEHTNFLTSREKGDKWPQKGEYLVDKIAAAIDQERAKIAILEKQNQIMREALEGLLSNISLDWYLNQFNRDISPTLMKSGIAATIHNKETLERIMLALKRARQALAEAGLKEKGE